MSSCHDGASARWHSSHTISPNARGSNRLIRRLSDCTDAIVTSAPSSARRAPCSMVTLIRGRCARIADAVWSKISVRWAMNSVRNPGARAWSFSINSAPMTVLPAPVGRCTSNLRPPAAYRVITASTAAR